MFIAKMHGIYRIASAAFVLLVLLWFCSGCGSKSSSLVNEDGKDSLDPFSEYYNISKSIGDSVNTVIAFGPLGQIYVLWEEKTSGKEGIYFSSSTGSNNTVLFKDPIKIHLGSDKDFKSPRVAIDSNGWIFVSYTGPDPFLQGGETHIYLAYSDNQGMNFSRVTRILSRLDGKDAESSSIAINPENNLFVAWVEGGEGSGEIVYATGPSSQPQTISTAQNIWNAQEDQDEPILGFDETGDVYASWSEGPLGGFEGTGNLSQQSRDIYFNRDINSSQQNPVNISATNALSNHPVLSCPDSQNIIVLWEEGISPEREIYYARSTDSGETFSSPENLSNTPQGDSYDAHITCGKSGSIYVVWTEAFTENKEIYFRVSTNWGDTFADVKNISQNSGASDSPQVTANSVGDVLVVWSDTTPGNQDIFAAGSQDNGISFTAPLNLSDNPGSSMSPKVGWDGVEQFVVAWVDDTWNNNKEIILRRGGWVSSLIIPTPILISPKNGDTTPGRPTFYWNPVSGATQYHLQVDDQADFSSPIIDKDLLTHSFHSTFKLSRGVYYARIKALDIQSRWTGYSLPIQFYVANPPQDINGDGYSDILAGAPATNSAAGEVYIYFGPSGSPPVVLAGEDSNDQFGSSVSIAGDVNGDGFEDILVGAPGVDTGIYRGSGKAYLYLGNGSGNPTLFGFFAGEGNNADLGRMVSGAGDVNGDGCADFLVGAPGASGGGARRGEVYLFFGGGGACAVSSLDLVPDLVLSGPSEASNFGSSLGTAGDVDRDSYDDFMIAAPGFMEGRGVVFMYLGSDSPNGIPGLSFNGSNSSDLFGYSIAPGGDINLDGYDDILIGSPGANNGNSTGKVTLYFGGPSMDNMPDITIMGENSFDKLGYAVAGIGDVDNDGYGDLLISAPEWDIQEPLTRQAGRTYLFTGASLSDRGAPLLPASEADVIWEGKGKSFYLGYGISGAGDFNGDDIDDFLIGTPLWKDGTGKSVGQVYLFYGKEDLLLNTTYDMIFYGDTPSGLFGSVLDKRMIDYQTDVYEW